jgi:hypothetical protein
MNAIAPERSTPIESISGLIEPVTFWNDSNQESGFCVLRLKTRGTGISSSNGSSVVCRRAGTLVKAACFRKTERCG